MSTSDSASEKPQPAANQQQPHEQNQHDQPADPNVANAPSYGTSQDYRTPATGEDKRSDGQLSVAGGSAGSALDSADELDVPDVNPEDVTAAQAPEGAIGPLPDDHHTPRGFISRGKHGQ